MTLPLISRNPYLTPFYTSPPYTMDRMQGSFYTQVLLNHILTEQSTLEKHLEKTIKRMDEGLNIKSGREEKKRFQKLERAAMKYLRRLEKEMQTQDDYGTRGKSQNQGSIHIRRNSSNLYHGLTSPSPLLDFLRNHA